MNTVNRYGLRLLAAMSFLLPIWLTVGKGMIFGVGGWVSLIYMFTLAPAIFAVLWLFFLLLYLRKDVKATRSIGTVDSILLLSLYVSIFLHGFYLLDGGDTKESVNSVASKHFNVSQELSSEYSGAFVALFSSLMFACLLVFIYEIIKKRAIKTDNLL